MEWVRNREELRHALGYDRPALFVDDVGTVAVAAPSNDHERLCAEFDPYGGIDISIYDDAAKKLRRVKMLHDER